MEFAVEPEERKILLRDLDDFTDSMQEIMLQRTGTDWDPYAANNGEGIALLVRARDDLASQDGPRSLDGTRAELGLLFARLRAGALKGLEVGADTGGFRWAQDLNVADPERADQHLDIVGVCDALLARLQREAQKEE